MVYYNYYNDHCIQKQNQLHSQLDSHNLTKPLNYRNYNILLNHLLRLIMFYQILLPLDENGLQIPELAQANRKVVVSFE